MNARVLPTWIYGVAFVAASTNASLAGPLPGGGYHCPCPQGVDTTTAGPVVKDSWMDTKGGTWRLTCTNSNPSGDFVWEYVPPGATDPKPPIGRCVYPRGENRTHFTRKDGGNAAIFTHTCQDRNNLKRAVMNIFNKNACTKLRMTLNYNNSTNRWEEDTSQRQYLSAADMEAVSTTDNDGDGIGDEGFALLSAGIVPPPPDHPQAFGERRLVLEVGYDTNAYVISWGVGLDPAPMMTPGDYLDIYGLTPSEVVSTNPLLSLSTVTEPDGIRLTATKGITLKTGMTALRINPASSGPYHYVVHDADVNAMAYYDALFAQHLDDPSVPLEDIMGGFATNINFADMRGYVGTAGAIQIDTELACCLGDETCLITDAPNCLSMGGVPQESGAECDACEASIPTVSHWGLLLIALSLLIAGSVIYGRRQSAIQ